MPAVRESTTHSGRTTGVGFLHPIKGLIMYPLVVGTVCILICYTLSPLTLKMFYFGICEVATDDVSHTTPVVVYLEIATMLCHNLLQVLRHVAAAFSWLQ